MSVGAIIAIVVVVLVILVVVAVASRLAARRSAERRRLGPEYDRMAEEVGPRKANAEFDKRRRRVDGLGIKPLSPERRALYGNQWLVAQERFVESPADSVRTAAALVTAVAADRGYEVVDAAQLQTDLSVHYGNQVDGYRSALALTDRADKVPTEQLRQALLGYRAMYNELAEVTDDGDGTAAVAAATDDPAATAPAAPAPRQAEDGTTHGSRVFWRRENNETSNAGSRP